MEFAPAARPRLADEAHLRDTLNRLVDIAELAYQRARSEVFDKLPPGTAADRAVLTDRQRKILAETAVAEAAVTAYRTTEYAGSAA